MNSVLVIATVGCVVANALIAIADYARAPFVLANSAEVGLPRLRCRTWLPSSSRAPCGLLMGLLGLHWLGLAAGVGLTVFFIGAVLAHVRARVFHNIAFPGGFLLLAVAGTTFFVGEL